METNLSEILNVANLSSFKSLNRPGGDAGWMYKRLVDTINDFEKNLSNDFQAGGRLISSQDIVFSIDNIGYWGPDMIIFYGTLSNGSQVELIQHISQLNLLLVAVPRTDDTSKPRRKITLEDDEVSS